MATFNEHIAHSKKNLDFLSKVNSSVDDSWDWQVTICFYTALHLMNAHIVKKTNKNYLTHNQVEEVINPYNALSIGKLDENTFLSYSKLCQLSRRSRYLLNENFKKGDDIQQASMTYSLHFKKAVHHLDVVIKYINQNYEDMISKNTYLKCIDLNGRTFDNFKII